MSASAKEIVVFPPVDPEIEAKVRGLLRSIGEFIGIELKPKVQTVLTVHVPLDRFDVYTVLCKIRLSIPANNKPKTPDKPSK